MSLKRENPSVAVEPPPKAIRYQEVLPEDDEESPQDPDQSSSHAPEEPTTVYISQPDGLKNLDSLPAPPMEVICGFFVAAGDFTSLVNLRKVNKGCKARVDHCFEQKKNAPAVDVVNIKCEDNRIEIKICMRVATLPLRPHLKYLRPYVTRVVPLNMARVPRVCSIIIAMEGRDEALLDIIGKFLSVQVPFMSVYDVQNLEQLRFINREVLDKTKIGGCDIFMADAFEQNAESSDELEGMAESHGIPCLSVKHGKEIKMISAFSKEDDGSDKEDLESDDDDDVYIDVSVMG